jgi:hypothetical protein
MADKWQQISLKLDAELAQVLREMKQGHDESLAEVVIRLLKRVVRQHQPSAREMPAGRANPKGRTARGAVGAGRRGKPAPAGRAGSRGAAPGKPWAAPAATGRARSAAAAPGKSWAAPAAAEWSDEGGKRAPARAAAPAAAKWSGEGGQRAPARAAAPARGPRGPRRIAGKVGKS